MPLTHLPTIRYVYVFDWPLARPQPRQGSNEASRDQGKAQGKAQDLISKHGRDTLEQVFLKLVRGKNEY